MAAKIMHNPVPGYGTNHLQSKSSAAIAFKRQFCSVQLRGASMSKHSREIELLRQMIMI